MLSISFEMLLESLLGNRKKCGEKVHMLPICGRLSGFTSAAEFWCYLFKTEWEVCRGIQTAKSVAR